MENLFNLSGDARKKSELLSRLIKPMGNNEFDKSDYHQALVIYNKALCFAQFDQFKSLLYGNRSAVYFMVGKYDLCLENIQLAKDHGYPQDKIDKLNEREVKCKVLMKGAKVDVHKKATSEFLKLSYKPHAKIPYIIDGIELKSSEKYGNYLITTKNLKTGDIIAIEPFTAHFASLHEGINCEKCFFCLRHNDLNLIPCDGCASTMYCSEDCKSQHYSLHHKTFCGKYIPTNWVEPCFRFMTAAVQEFGSFKEFYKLLKNPVKKTIFDFDEMTRKNFISIVCSFSSHEKGTVDVEELSKLDVEPLDSRFHDLFPTENLDDVKDCYNRVSSLYCTYSMTLEEYRKASDATVCKFGARVGAFSVLFNHSCDPNVSRISFNNQKVFYVKRPIKVGEQLFITYRPEYTTQSRKERQSEMKLFGFNCDCTACENDYPLTDNLRKIAGGHLVKFYDEKSFTAAEMIKYYKRNCTMIEKYQKDHPCYETTYMMDLNNQVLYDIAKSMRI